MTETKDKEHSIQSIFKIIDGSGQSIFKIIDESGFSTDMEELDKIKNKLDKIKNYCEKLQNDYTCKQKSQKLKDELKEFRKYDELKSLIDGIEVINLKYEEQDNIMAWSDASNYEYDINLNNVIELNYSCSLTFGKVSSLDYTTSDGETRSITMYRYDCIDSMALDLLNEYLDEIYIDMKLKHTSKETLKEFLLVLMEKIKYRE